MSERSSTAGVPKYVSFFNPIAKPLLAAGVPMGFNGLITIRGRTSGIDRTAAVAIIEASDRRWVWCPWGDVHWVRNLRAAGNATITVRGHKESVRAVELDASGRIAFFRDILPVVASNIPFGKAFIRIVDGVDLDRPLDAAEGRCVFELHPGDAAA